jgi:hypothetical protein
MACGKPNWQLLKEVAEKLTREKKVPFTRGQLIEGVRQLHPDVGENTLNPMIQGMTINLQGGAPGGLGKNVLFSIDRGSFELYDAVKHNIRAPAAAPSINETISDNTSSEILKAELTDVEPKIAESEVRDLLMQVLFHRLGKDGTWSGAGKLARFDLGEQYGGFKCFAEKSLMYTLPSDEKLSHCSDILISNTEKNRHISLEIKHRSAVTDQFKCRSYDIMHLKRTYGDNLLGVMVYVKTTTGLSVRQARSICYSFDHFFSVDSVSKHIPTAWDDPILAIENFVSKETI